MVLQRGRSQSRGMASAVPIGERTDPKMNALLRLVVIVGLIGYGYSQIRQSNAVSDAEIRQDRVLSGSKSSRCDGRQYCSQMKSCAEAKYFIKHCPQTKMDGDGDGIPCEQQWCN